MKKPRKPDVQEERLYPLEKKILAKAQVQWDKHLKREEERRKKRIVERIKCARKLSPA